MDAGGFFRGTSADQDSRFCDKTKKYIASTEFPPEFDRKVDMKKVCLDAIRPWITNKITQLLGFEDDVLINFTFGLLEGQEKGSPNPKELQHHLEGFLDKDTPAFVLELWNLLLSAQEHPTGIPLIFIEQKKDELRQTRADSDRIKAEVQKQNERANPDDRPEGERDKDERDLNSKENGRDKKSDHSSRDRDRRTTNREKERDDRRGRDRNRDRDRDRNRDRDRDRDRDRNRDRDRDRNRDRDRGRDRDRARDRDRDRDRGRGRNSDRDKRNRDSAQDKDTEKELRKRGREKETTNETEERELKRKRKAPGDKDHSSPQPAERRSFEETIDQPAKRQEREESAAQDDENDSSKQDTATLRSEAELRKEALKSLETKMGLNRGTANAK